MSEPQDAPPTAHQDEESSVAAAGVDAPGSPTVPILDQQAPTLAGKRADERTAAMDQTDPPLRDA